MPKKTNRTKECERDINRTLAYSSVFKCPLTKYQLYNFLISNQVYNPKYFETNLNRLVKDKIIKENKGRYYLFRSKTVNWDKRYKISKNKIYKSKDVFKSLSKIPWIRMLAVTGSVSNYSASSNNDIDLFIITKNNRLWLTRFFVVLILKIYKKYRLDSKNDLCPNLYLTESEMTWPNEDRNIYIAHSIITMQPIINKDSTYFRFLTKNFWIFDYFKHFSLSTNENDFIKDLKLKHTKNHLFDLIETIFSAAQRIYMKSKITSEIISRHFVHFNKNDHSQKILYKYKKVLSNRKIS